MDIYENGVKVTPKATPEIKPPEKLAATVDPEIARELTLRSYRDLLGAYEADPEADTKIEYIVKRLKEGGTKTDEIEDKLKSLSLKVGGDPFESKVDRIYRYLRLLQEVSSSVVSTL
jgi:hypothetical protein